MGPGPGPPTTQASKLVRTSSTTQLYAVTVRPLERRTKCARESQKARSLFGVYGCRELASTLGFNSWFYNNNNTTYTTYGRCIYTIYIYNTSHYARAPFVKIPSYLKACMGHNMFSQLAGLVGAVVVL